MRKKDVRKAGLSDNEIRAGGLIVGGHDDPAGYQCFGSWGMRAMSNEEIEVGGDLEVGVIKAAGCIRWFRMDRTGWVLNWQKWEVDLGVREEGERDADSVDGGTVVEQFLRDASGFEIAGEWLRAELIRRMPGAKSFWDVVDLFPIAFVDVDRRHYGAFYLAGIKLEHYIPGGWTGEFVDFANDYDGSIFPASDKFWICDGIDLLATLNERGAKLSAEAQPKIIVKIR
jgi:hypothetical protein